jgi:hypothetical protein
LGIRQLACAAARRALNVGSGDARDAGAGPTVAEVRRVCGASLSSTRRQLDDGRQAWIAHQLLRYRQEQLGLRPAGRQHSRQRPPHPAKVLPEVRHSVAVFAVRDEQLDKDPIGLERALVARSLLPYLATDSSAQPPNTNALRRRAAAPAGSEKQRNARSAVQGASW